MKHNTTHIRQRLHVHFQTNQKIKTFLHSKKTFLLIRSIWLSSPYLYICGYIAVAVVVVLVEQMYITPNNPSIWQCCSQSKAIDKFAYKHWMWDSISKSGCGFFACMCECGSRRESEMTILVAFFLLFFISLQCNAIKSDRTHHFCMQMPFPMIPHKSKNIASAVAFIFSKYKGANMGNDKWQLRWL